MVEASKHLSKQEKASQGLGPLSASAFHLLIYCQCHACQSLLASSRHRSGEHYLTYLDRLQQTAVKDTIQDTLRKGVLNTLASAPCTRGHPRACREVASRQASQACPCCSWLSPVAVLEYQGAVEHGLQLTILGGKLPAAAATAIAASSCIIHALGLLAIHVMINAAHACQPRIAQGGSLWRLLTRPDLCIAGLHMSTRRKAGHGARFLSP